MREFLLFYGGGLGALCFMTVATLVPHKGIRVLLSVFAGLALVAHSGFLLVLIAIASWGGNDSAIEALCLRLLLFGGITLIWAFVLVSLTPKRPSKAPERAPDLS